METDIPTTTPYKEKFVPFKVDTDLLLHDMELLEDGEALHVGHAATILNVGDVKVCFDPIIEGKELELAGRKIFEGRVFPPLGTDSLKIDKKDAVYDRHLVETKESTLQDLTPEMTNTKVVGESLGFGSNYVFISHLDPDHLDMELISSMTTANPDLKVYGPKGMVEWLEKANAENPKLEEVKKHIFELEPNRVFAKDNSVEKEENQFSKIDLGNGTTATVFEIVHEGSARANVTQAFLVENGDTRVLSCPEAALSPEIINILKKVQTPEKPLTSIILSTAIYNPDKFHEILPENTTKKYKDEIEEFTAHSAYLPFIFLALTNGEVPIDLVHHGFYYKDRAEKKNIPYRIPISENPNTDASMWMSNFRNFLGNMEQYMEKKLTPLKPSSFPKAKLPERIDQWNTRRKFSKSIRNWMKDNPVPKELLDKINIPQGGETITKTNQPSMGKLTSS